MMLAPSPNLIAETPFRYADGVPGVYQTLGIMRAMVRAYKTDPTIRQAATSAVFLSPEKDDLHEVETLFNLVRDNIRYVRDICDVETLSTPDVTLQGRIGDCDDKTVLLCSLLEAIGYKTRFVIAGYYTPSNYEHVYCQVFVPVLGDWVSCDATERGPLGYEPPNPVAYAVEKV